MNIRIIRALSVALVLAFVFFIATAPIQATPITFGFTSQLPLGTTYGTGSLTFDNSLLSSPLPISITQADLTGFSYVDPNAGSFGLGNLAVLFFVLGTTPTTSSFQFIATGGPGTFIGGTVDGNNGGGVSLSFGPTGITSPSLRYPTASIPEPSSLLLLGTGLIGIAAVRKFRPR